MILAADRPEISASQTAEQGCSGHVLSETAGAFASGESLIVNPDGLPGNRFSLQGNGQHRRGKTGFFLEACALPVLFGSNPLIQRRALALLPWGQAPRRHEDES